MNYGALDFYFPLLSCGHDILDDTATFLFIGNAFNITTVTFIRKSGLLSSSLSTYNSKVPTCH